GIMSNQVPQNEQGELQGINASLGSITAIIGPLLMTQSFSYFTGPETPYYFPGVAFLIAAVLAVVAVIIFTLSARVLDLRLPPAT
ncbi:MAG: DHA1 family tetracycline resistance protein-like MFS transporter, partial [Candidatus Azotimanducaceae bacterium]